jgi:uncharacterized repeat protein (TIGR02543 family)
MKFRILLTVFLLAVSQATFADMCYTAGYYSMSYTCWYMTVTAQAGGTVTSSPNGISCPGTCSSSYINGNLTLTATAGAGYTFTGWSGDCTGTSTCTVSMNADHTVVADFTALSPTVTPQTGFWFNPAESGRGFVIEQHSDNKLFIGGFMYDANGNAIWYASGPAVMANGTTYTGEWAQYGGGQTLTGSYKAPTVPNPDVGSITLTFLTATTANLTLPNGVVIPLQRFPF